MFTTMWGWDEYGAEIILMGTDGVLKDRK